jgi:hypothetical protein
MTKRSLLPTLCLVAALIPASAVAGGFSLTPVPNAAPTIPGMAMPNTLSPELFQIIVAQGSMPLENPTSLLTTYGYAADGPMVPPANAIPGLDSREASKTEPDKNTYLVLADQTGPDAAYDYGTRFLFQGHEGGILAADGRPQGYLTRINLDADAAHRITLMADRLSSGDPFPFIDGSTFDPFADRLLLTGEGGGGGLWQATTDFPSVVDDLTGIAGRGSYEGVQVDPDGTIWLVEDADGEYDRTTRGLQPNSFVYRLIPKDKTDLTKGGRLEVLQIMDTAGRPLIFHDGLAIADILSLGMKELHTYGLKLKTRWVLIHDTDKDGTTPFDPNAAAKAAGGTPLKRPENGVFRPGTGFTEFVIAETGDNNAKTAAGSEFGGFGAIHKLAQAAPSAAEGEITLVYRGDAEHAAFDNLSFWSTDEVLVVEDRGEKMHEQANALDSGWVIDLTADYSNPATMPVRFLAGGRDTAATIDAGLAALPDTGFQNSGDNEITGIHVSDGDASAAGLLGAKTPTPFENGWRVFWTQQHGENTTWEILSRDILP